MATTESSLESGSDSIEPSATNSADMDTTDSNSNDDDDSGSVDSGDSVETTVAIDDNENQSGSNDDSTDNVALIGKDSSDNSFASEKGTSETLVGLICGAVLLSCLLVSGAAIYCHRRGKGYGSVQMAEENEVNETVCGHQIIECHDSEDEEDGLPESNTLIYG